MPEHFFKSFEHLTDKDMALFLADSSRYEHLIKRVYYYLQLDHLIGFHWLRLIDFKGVQLLSTLSAKELSLYFRSGLWRFDNVITPEQTVAYKIVDYYDEHSNNAFVSEHKNEVYLIVERQYKHYMDKFTFDIQRDYFESLSSSSKIRLYDRLDNIINLLHSTVAFHHTLYFSDYEISLADVTSSVQEVQQAYGITEKEVDYLRYIATGNTAKEMALHMNLSYRSIQNNIRALSKKLKCESKQQLTVMAGIITSYIQPSQVNML